MKQIIKILYFPTISKCFTTHIKTLFMYIWTDYMLNPKQWGLRKYCSVLYYTIYKEIKNYLQRLFLKIRKHFTVKNSIQYSTFIYRTINTKKQCFNIQNIYDKKTQTYSFNIQHLNDNYNKKWFALITTTNNTITPHTVRPILCWNRKMPFKYKKHICFSQRMINSMS